VPLPDLFLVYLVAELSITHQPVVVVAQTGFMKRAKVQHIVQVHLLAQMVSTVEAVAVVQVPLVIRQLTALQLQTLLSKEPMVELAERVRL
jgi:hypothetical protein